MPKSILTYKCRRCGNLFTEEITVGEEWLRERLKHHFHNFTPMAIIHDEHCIANGVVGFGIADLIGGEVVEES